MALTESKMRHIRDYLSFGQDNPLQEDISTPIHHQYSQALVAAGMRAPQESIQDLDPALMEEFKSQVRLWMELDSQIKRLTQEVRERKKVQNEMHQRILSFMARYNIEDLNTQHGVLRFKRTVVKAPLSQKSIKEKLLDKLGKNPEAASLIEGVFSDRGKREKTTLRRIN